MDFRFALNLRPCHLLSPEGARTAKNDNISAVSRGRVHSEVDRPNPRRVTHVERESSRRRLCGVKSDVNRSVIMNRLAVTLCCLLSAAMLPHASAFNLDTENVLVYEEGGQGSMFGFSVAAHIDQDTGWVLIGAPEADTDQRRWGVYRPGAVYRCETTPPYSCYVIPFDTTGNNNDTGHTIDDKSHQWFGATVTSSGPDGVVVACAPRYVYFSINKKRMEPVGTCFTAVESFTRFSEYSPCRTAAWGYHRQGYCQAGFSAAVTKERLFIGTPGSYYWQGQAYSQNLWNRLDLIATEEGPESEDNTYLGYSLAIGRFDPDPYPDLIVGMPRGANLTGKVIFLAGTSMGQILNLTGSQVGAYFGHSLAVCDVNGDGMDDVIIGAPLHTDYSASSGRYETGRIYVVYQSKEYKFRKWHIRDGEQSRARFGFSLASLGDMDKDGYGDFAVGAPYGGQAGEGVVYIYRGSKSGVRERPDQVISGLSVRPRLLGFGFSLSGARDLDHNAYNDLVVGAPYSGQTVLLRARPVVNLEAEVKLMSEGGQIDINNKTCYLHSIQDYVTCTQIQICFRYSGIGVYEKISISTRLELDMKKQHNSRMLFLPRDVGEQEDPVKEEIIPLHKEIQLCRTSDVYLIPNLRDKLTALEAKLTVHLPQTKISGELSPVLGLGASGVEFYSSTGLADDIGLITRDTVNIQKDCGEDNICVPDLRISYSRNLLEYSVGSEDRFEITLEIHNAGEDAYEATFVFEVPQATSYIRTEVMDSVGGDTPVLCSPPTPANNQVLKCDLGNPMIAGTKAYLRVILQPDISHLEDVSTFEMRLEVNSSNPDSLEAMADNVVNISLPVIVETDLTIRGLSSPEVLRFNRSTYQTEEEEITEEGQIGPEIMHIYQVENQGPSDIVEAEVFILWPSFRQDEGEAEDSHLLYLTSQPVVEGPGSCEFVTDVNLLNIKVAKFLPGRTMSLHTSIRTNSTNPEDPALPQENHEVLDSLHNSQHAVGEDSFYYGRNGGQSYLTDDDLSSEHYSEQGFESKHAATKEEMYQHADNQVFVNGHRYVKTVKHSSSYSSSKKTFSSEEEDHYLVGGEGGRRRPRRDAESDFLADLNCGTSRCTFISCVVGPLQKREFTLFKIRSRLWVRTLEKVPRNDIEISSKLVTRVTRLPYGVNPSYLGHRIHLVTTQVLATELIDGGSIPLWILVLAIIAGLMFLSLLTYILHRLGFFKRKRPEDFNYTATIQEKPYSKESKNQLVSSTTTTTLSRSNTNGHNYTLLPSTNSYTGSSRGSNGSASAAYVAYGPPVATWSDPSCGGSSQRYSQTSVRNSGSMSLRNSGTTSLRNSGTSANTAIYYPGQRHPDMLPGDEAL